MKIGGLDLSLERLILAESKITLILSNCSELHALLFVEDDTSELSISKIAEFKLVNIIKILFNIKMISCNCDKWLRLFQINGAINVNLKLILNLTLLHIKKLTSGAVSSTSRYTKANFEIPTTGKCMNRLCIVTKIDKWVIIGNWKLFPVCLS